MPTFRTLIPAAGESQRFREGGHETPKPDLRIECAGRTRLMLDWVLDAHEGRVVAVGAHRDSRETYDHPIRRFRVAKTRGQAHTLLQLVRRACPLDIPVLVVNCDMIIPSDSLQKTMSVVEQGADFGVLVARTSRAGMSHVDRIPHPTQFLEKNGNGDIAMVGAWAFASSRQLEDALRGACEDLYEPYLSHALARLKGVCTAVECGEDDFTDWGTPEAVAASGARIVE